MVGNPRYQCRDVPFRSETINIYVLITQSIEPAFSAYEICSAKLFISVSCAAELCFPSQARADTDVVYHRL